MQLDKIFNKISLILIKSQKKKFIQLIIIIKKTKLIIKQIIIMQNLILQNEENT